MTGQETASEDFNKARNKAKFQGLMSALTWKSNDLMPLYEVTSIIKPRSETYLGMRSIPVEKVIGSECRYRDFSSAFYPKTDRLRTRWESIDNARINDIALPAISVYELGGYYFVRDGNHRVSVARSQGVEFIDAEVVELDTEIPIKPGMSMKELKAKTVAYERNMFLQQYPTELPMGAIVFNTPGAYPEMVNHINVHKYYINEQVHDHEITFNEAAMSWFENVYKPIVKAIRQEHLLAAFPGESEGDMYMWVVRRWDELKREKRDISAEEAVKKAANERGANNVILRTKRTIGYVADKLTK